MPQAIIVQFKKKLIRSLSFSTHIISKQFSSTNLLYKYLVKKDREVLAFIQSFTPP